MKKPILYIHGGTHKTGTTSIQFFLQKNYEYLKNNSILYPIAGREELLQHHYLFSSIRNPIHPYFRSKKSFMTYMDDLENEINIERPEQVIISSEIFGELINQDISTLKNYIHEISKPFSEIKVIFYIRRPDLYGISANNTNIWYGMQKEHILSYPNILRWTKILDRNQLVFKPFEKEQFIEENLLSDFINLFGIKNDNNLILTEIFFNESVSNDTIELCRILNNIYPNSNDIFLIKNRLAEMSEKDDIVNNSFFSPQERLYFIKKHEYELTFIAKKFLGRKDGRLFYEPYPKINEDWEQYPGLTIEKAITILTQLIFLSDKKI